MPIITKEEKNSIIDIMQTYRKLHERISNTEETVKRLESEMIQISREKDSLIAQIQANRDKENTLIQDMIERYGKGKLVIEDMEWKTE